MDDQPPLQKIAIYGPTLASLIQRSTITSSSSIDGLLFGHVTFVTPLNLSDDSSDTSQTLVATVTGFLTSSSFHNTSGIINTTSLRRLIPRNTSLLGWFSGRRRTPLRPSLREFTITSSLSSLSQFSSTIKPNSDSNSNSFSSLSSSLNFNPSLFFLLASPVPDQTSYIHTHDYRAYQFLTGTQSFNPVSINIINIGPAFRSHYGSFSPNSPFPALDCQLSYSPMMCDEDDVKLSTMMQAAKDQRKLDICSEGFEVGRLSKLMGSDAKNYTQSLEDLYLKMLAKIENLTPLVEESSAKVLEKSKVREDVRMVNDMPSQFPSQPQSLRNTAKKNVDRGVDNDGTHSKDNMHKDALEEAHEDAPEEAHEVPGLAAPEEAHEVPGLASQIEDLVELISKRSPGNTGCERSVSFCGEDNPNPHAVFGLSTLFNRRNRDNSDSSQDERAEIHDSQESQEVGYEEDLSGRQALLDALTRRH